MPIEILMPALSPTMTEGNLVNWLVKEGDKVKPGMVIAEIETDKATMEVESVDAGTVGKILVPAGTENVKVNSLIALLLKDGEDAKSLASYKSAPTVKAEAPAPKKEAASAPKTLEKAPETPDPKSQTVSAPTAAPAPTPKNLQAGSNKDAYASPLAKKLAQENNVPLNAIEGSGPGGRVVKEDVLNFLENGVVTSGKTVRRNAEEYYTVKNSNVRKVIARRLSESKQTVPHFYLATEVEMDRLTAMREEVNHAAHSDEKGKPEYKISINDLFIKASALALRDHPKANSSWGDDSISIYNNVDISVAVSIDDGLITPVIRNADQKDIISLSDEAKVLIKKARDGKLQPEEFQGGSFSISNLGMYDVTSFAAIVNPPQSCILAVGATKEVVTSCKKTGGFTVKHICTIVLSVDHRSVDGALAAELLKSIKKYIEHPSLMLL